MSQNAPVAFQLATAATWSNPWPMYRALRDRPVHHVVPANSPEHDYYVLSRHADVWAAARDHETFSSAKGLTVNYDDLELIGLQDNPPFVMQDPPVHTQFRKLVSRGFTPRQVEAVEPKVREFVVERIEGLRAAGGGDIVTELFKPLPSMVVAHYLGVPEEDWVQFDGWTQAIVAANTAEGGVAGALETVGDAVGSMMAYFTGLIERRRTDPEDDTISHLVTAGVGADGDVAGTLSILAFTFTMVTGGNDTVTGMLGGSMPLLHERPDQRKLLVDNPELITDAVEELLRMTSPVQGLARTTTREVTIGDTTIPAGRRALLLYGSANRDERQYGPDAAELDVTRCPRNILTFSHGAHHCLGAAAAGCSPGWRSPSCWPDAPTSRSTNQGSPGPGAITCGGRCRCRFVWGPDAGKRLAFRAAQRSGRRPDTRRGRGTLYPTRLGFDRHERNRQGRRVFPSDAVPVFRESRGIAHRVRAPRDPPARPRHPCAHRRHRGPARKTGREHPGHLADGARESRAGVMVCHDAPAGRRRVGRPVRRDRGPGGGVPELVGSR